MIYKHSHKKCFVQIVFILLICSSAVAERVITPWQLKFEGVEHATGQTDQPRLQKVNAIRVDLHDPNVQLITTPSNDSDPGDTVGRTGSQFMNEFGVQIGVNANYFDVQDPPPWPNARIIGLAMSQGQIVSEPEDLGPDSASLLVSQDNNARIIRTSLTTGLDLSRFWTAVTGWPWLLSSGSNHHDPASTSVHPRTAVGLTLDRRYLIIITVDGRQPGYSEGSNHWETAEWLRLFGAHTALNLDGGGSTHMWIAQPNGSTYALNSPSGNRSVANHLGIYAAPLPVVFDPQQVYADFESGPATFAYDPGYSGSTTGIDSSASSSTLTSEHAHQGSMSQKLTIIDDPASPGWFVRHISGSAASRQQNIIRPTRGYVGLWARTENSGLEVSIAIDNTEDVTADRGTFRPMIDDGQWHLYQWNLEADDQWHGWINANGMIDTPDFTIDSIQIRSQTSRDAEIYLDYIVHFSRGSIEYWDSLCGDFQLTGKVEMPDYAMFAEHWLSQVSDSKWNRIFDLNSDDIVDVRDLAIFVEHWLQTSD